MRRLLFAFLVVVFIGLSCVWLHLSIEQPTWRSDNVGSQPVRSRWGALPITWSFLCGEAEVPQFRDGFSWWNEQYGDVFREVPQEDTCLCSPFDGGCPRVLVFEGLDDPMLLDAGMPRFAATYLVVDAGTIVAGAIRFYEPFGDASPAAQQSIARHEAGHVLGLMHSALDDCLMYPSVKRDERYSKTLCRGEDLLFRTTYEVP